MSEEINLIIRSMKVAKTFPFLRKLKISRKDTVLLLNYIDNLQSTLEKIRDYLEYYLIGNMKFEDSQEQFKKLLQIIDKAMEGK